MIHGHVVVIGAMKSGTTALFQTLRQHPEIAPSHVKETNFFCVARPRDLEPQRYAAHWSFDPSRHRWALEASTNYAKLPCFTNPAVFAHRLSPARFRFIYMVRDPVERIRSQYLHSLAEGWIQRPIHEGVLEQALLISNYHFQSMPYLYSFGEDAFLVVRYEDFVQDRERVLQRICGFLEIDATFPFRDPGSQNGSDRYRNRLLARAIDQTGVLAQPLEPRASDWDHGSYRAHCRGLLEAVGGGDRLEPLEEALRRSYEPSPEQSSEIRERLAFDLELFRRRFGLADWEDRPRRGRPPPANRVEDREGSAPPAPMP